MAMFDDNQSAIEYGESLLASQDERRKRNRKKSKKIQKVNMVLAGFALADQFLTKNAQNKVKTFTENLTSEKAREIHNLNLATRWRTEAIKPLMSESPSLNLDDPDAFKKNGSVFNALKAKEIKMRKTATGEYGKLTLSEKDQAQINKAAELNTARLEKEYNRYQGYLDTSQPLLDTKYKNLLERGTKDILSPKNTSSVRKLLGKFNIANKLESDLIESEYKGIYIPSDDKTFENLVKSRQQAFENSKLSTDPKAVKEMEELNAYWTNRKESPKKIPELSEFNQDTLYNSILDKDKNYRIGEFLDEVKIQGTNLPRREDNLTYTKLFSELSEYDTRNLIRDINVDLEQLIAVNSTPEQDYKLTVDDVAKITLNRASQILKTSEETTGPLGMGMFGGTTITYNYPPQDSEFVRNSSTPEEPNEPSPDLPSNESFSVKLGIFERTLQNESKEIINEQLKALVKENPDQFSQIMDLYDLYKNQSKDTPSPTPTPTPVEPDTDLALMSASELEEYAERGGERAFERSSIFSDQIDSQSRKRLERYVNSGGKSKYGIKNALERFGLPVDASVEDIEMFLDRNPLPSLLARN
jgi:hypothetical protein